MKKLIQEHKEILQVVATILGVVIIIGGLFIVSEKVGDRSKDKSGATQQEQPKNALLEEGQELDEEKMKELTEITYAEFKTHLKNKKTTTLVMLGSESCYWCQEQKPILKMAMYEHNVDVKYLDVSKITADELAEIEALHKDLEGFGTPVFITVKNKKVLKVSPNAKSTSQLYQMFKDMNMIKEK